jgi:ElaB/YqjD/DUF883 family membrane-anchored ribosome-binding protein
MQPTISISQDRRHLRTAPENRQRTNQLGAIVFSQNKVGGSWERLRYPGVVQFQKRAILVRAVQRKGNTAMAKDTIHDINATTDYAADKGHTEIDELRRQVKDLTEKYGSMAQAKLSDVKEKVQQNVGDIEQQIRDKPVQATLIAAGVGFLVGALLSR